MLSLDRKVKDRIYIDNRIRLEVLDIGQQFVVMEFCFWDEPLPVRLNLVPQPSRSLVKACRAGRYIPIANGARMIVVKIIDPHTKVRIGIDAPPEVKVDRGEIRQQQHLRVA